MRRRFATFALLLAWLCANGAAWDVLQVAAWGKMFAGYSQTMSISSALLATLDPSKPCELCVGIADAKDAAKENAPASEQSRGVKFLMLAEAADLPVLRTDPETWLAAPAQTLAKRTDPVPVPPPRV